MVDNGIKPVYVFDGKPPDMKSGEVRKIVLLSKLLIRWKRERYIQASWPKLSKLFMLQLAKRKERREEAEKSLQQATEAGSPCNFPLPNFVYTKFVHCASSIAFDFFSGDEENVNKFQKRLVKVTKEHNDECKQLLKLMGIPYVDVRVSFFVSLNIPLFLLEPCSLS